jgi:hypothetical protein
MRNKTLFVAVLAFIVTASLGLATMSKGSQEEFTVSGKVLSIEDGILSLKGPNGETFNIASKSDKLEGIEAGDRVVVREAGGWAVSIHKMQQTVMKPHAKQKIEENATTGQVYETSPALN